MTRPLIFVGARGDFSLFSYVAEALGHNVIGILDQYYHGNTNSIQDIPIIGSELQLLDADDKEGEYWRQDCNFIVTSSWNGSQHLNDIGLNNEMVRRQRCDLVDRVGVNVINLIDPDTAYTPGKNLKLGRGILMSHHSGFASNVTIGDHCYFDSLIAFGHDTTIGRNVSFGTHCTTSNCVIEDNVRIGVHCNIVGGQDNRGLPLRVGTGSTLWNGVSLYRDVPPDSIVAPPMPKILAKQRNIN